MLKSMFKFVLMLVFIIAIGFVILMLVDIHSQSWEHFKQWALVIKWLIIPTGIFLLPKIIFHFTKKTLTNENKRHMLQCQLMMGLLFLVTEIMRGLS